MDRIARLNRREEAALQATAEKFVAECDGDVWKALKSMIMLNGELMDKLETSTRPAPPPRPIPKLRPRATSVQQQFSF